MRILSTARRRLAVAVAISVVTTAALVGLTASSAQANTVGTGYKLPAGAASNWIGSYNVSNDPAFCADPTKDWPGSTTYSAVKTTKTWTDSVTGNVRPNEQVARVAWILFEYRSKLSHAPTAAAVDASIYAILSRGQYAFNQPLFNNRVNATGRGTEIRALAKKMIDDSEKYAGPYKVAVTTDKPNVKVGDSFTAKSTLTSKTSGEGIPSKKVTFKYKGVTKTATTNNNGVARATFRADDVRAVISAEVADLASNAVSYRTPAKATSQRVLTRSSGTSVSGDTRIGLTRPNVLVRTTANASTAQLVGGTVNLHDVAVISEADAAYSNTATFVLYGPYTVRPTSTDCLPADEAGRVTAAVSGNGSVASPSVAVSQEGYYTWVANLPAVGDYTRATHPCGMTNETTLVGPPRSTPSIDTTTSDAEVPTGTAIRDNVTVADISLPCVDANGVYVPNPNGLDCDDVVITPGSPGTPAVTGAWTPLSAFDHCFDPRDLEGLDLSDPNVQRDLSLLQPQLEAPDGSVGAAAATYWATTGTQAECEAIILIPATASTPDVTAQDAPGFTTTATAHLYGPYPTLADATCMEDPYDSVTFNVTGNGTVTTPDVTVGEPGIYTWVIDLPGNEYIEDVITDCGIVAETTLVKNQPTVRTLTSEFVVSPGAEIYDTVWIEGTAGTYEHTVTAHLYGPYESRADMDCVDAPFETVTFDAAGDGEYNTPTVELVDAGYYTWVEEITGDDMNFDVVTACGISDETSLVQSQPELITKTSHSEIEVGYPITDTLIVSGVVGDFLEEANANLYGPFASMDDLDCSVKPYATVKVTVDGNGEFITPPVAIDAPGYYTWHEEFAGNELNAGFTHDCGLVEETTFVTRTPDEPRDPEIPKVPSGFTGFAPAGIGSLFLALIGSL